MSRWRNIASAGVFVRDAVENWLDAERHQLPLWTPVLLGVGIAAYFLLPMRAQWLAAGLCAVAVLCAGLALTGLAGRPCGWRAGLSCAGWRWPGFVPRWWLRRV